jgi:hypothetical protein
VAKRRPKKEFCLVSVTGKHIVLRAGKPVIINVAQPPRGEDFSKKYRRMDGYDFAAVEIEISQHHTGEPRYVWRDEQKAIVTKVIAPPIKKEIA